MPRQHASVRTSVVAGCAGLVLSVASPASADIIEQFMSSNVPSFGGLGSPNNAVLSFEVTSLFVPGFLDIIGIWGNPGATGTFDSEARVVVTPPPGVVPNAVDLLLGRGAEPQAGVPDGTPYKQSRLDFANIPDPRGVWTFRFYEDFVDNPAGPDMVWQSIKIRFTTDTQPTNLDKMSISTLGAGSAINGNNTQQSPFGDRSFLDGPNGFTPYSAQDGFAYANWGASENVYAIDWLGGDAVLRLNINDPSADLDLFLYGNSSATNLIGFSVGEFTSQEEISVPNLPAGRYWVVIDGKRCDMSDYSFQVVPTPGATGLAALTGALVMPGRRRRASASSQIESKNTLAAAAGPRREELEAWIVGPVSSGERASSR